MKNFLFYKIFSLIAFGIITGLSMGSVFGQTAAVLGGKPAFEDLQSPEFSGGKQKPFKPKDWLEIETKLKISMGAGSKARVCEKLVVKWYVAVKNPDPSKSGTLLLLTKDVEHMNVPLEEEIYCSVYLSPVSIKRLTGFDRAGKNAVDYVGYEVLVNGEKVLQETSKGRPGWWNAASDKISRSDSVPLLNKNETPFRAMWWDRYAEVTEGRGTR
jgi:hypothetical protein